LGGYLAVIVLFTALASYLLVQAMEQTVVLYLLGVVAVLLFVEPIVGLCIYLAFMYVNPAEYIPALQGIRVMLVLGMATLVRLLIRRAMDKDSAPLRVAPQGYLLAWLFLAVAASHLSHLDVDAASESLLDLVPKLVVYVLIVNLITTPGRLRLVLYVMLLVTVALAGQAIFQTIVGRGFFAYQTFKEGRVWGIAAFRNPNMLAIGLVCILPFAYLMLIELRSKLAVLLVAAATVVIMWALYLTNSRGGVLTWGLVTSILLVRRVGYWRGILVAGAVMVLMFVFGPSRMSTISPADTSAYGRLVLWSAGLEMVRQYPFFGIGANAWGVKYDLFVAHNSFVEAAAELGFFGLIPWVMVFVLSLRHLLYVSRHSEESIATLRAPTEAVLLAVMGFVFASLFITKAYHQFVFVLLGLAAAVTCIFVDNSEHRFRLVEGSDVLLTVSLSIFGLVGLAVALSLFGL
jgi:O-antigen ligase